MSWAAKETPTDYEKPKKKRVAIMISGTGTNMVALVAYSRNPAKQSAAEIVVVVCNRADAGGVKKARELGIPVEVRMNINGFSKIISDVTFQIIDHKAFGSREAYDHQVNACLENHNVELVCLAGYMRICSSEISILSYNGRKNSHKYFDFFVRGLRGKVERTLYQHSSSYFTGV